MIRVARLAIRDIESLTIAQRAELLEDVALMLPKREADAAAASAYALRQALSFQQDFFAYLK
jgi:hypothetical protein